jgi:hypothetical protein
MMQLAVPLELHHHGTTGSERRAIFPITSRYGWFRVLLIRNSMVAYQ